MWLWHALQIYPFSLNLAGMYSRLDRFVILFDHHSCGNLVNTKDDLSSFFSPKTASLNIANNGKYKWVQYNNSEQEHIIRNTYKVAQKVFYFKLYPAISNNSFLIKPHSSYLTEFKIISGAKLIPLQFVWNVIRRKCISADSSEEQPQVSAFYLITGFYHLFNFCNQIWKFWSVSFYESRLFELHGMEFTIPYRDMLTANYLD